MVPVSRPRALMVTGKVTPETEKPGAYFDNFVIVTGDDPGFVSMKALDFEFPTFTWPKATLQGWHVNTGVVAPCARTLIAMKKDNRTISNLGEGLGIAHIDS
jgi:hypothetical protein